ncbi:MAG: hypothetical protein GDA48_13080 [Hormoscilla sp. GM102CHS1]|nr:hypothetical protein [Hormoscilla sp. GM102CHS1]
MLKLTYIENDFKMERLEDWVETRIMLARQAGVGFNIEGSTASFLLPIDLPYLSKLQVECAEAIALSACDADYIEVSLKGTWIASEAQGEEGVFVLEMGDRAEFLLFNLWQESLAYVSAMKD